MNILGGMGNMLNNFSTMGMMGMNSGFNLGIGININLNRMMPGMTDGMVFSGNMCNNNIYNPSMFNSMQSPFASNMGFGMGMGMIPGFGGCCNQMGSMFGGVLQQMQQQQQQQQMMMMMMMLMQMQSMMQQQGMGGYQNNGMGYPMMNGNIPGMNMVPGTQLPAGAYLPNTGSMQNIYSSTPLNQFGSNGVGGDVVRLAASRIGDPYSQPLAGKGRFTDCSYLTQWAYKQKGINLPRTAAEQARYCEQNGMAVTRDQLQPGDLVFWSHKPNGRYKNITHVGIYAGNGKVIDASSSKGQVVHRNIFQSANQVSFGRPRQM